MIIPGYWAEGIARHRERGRQLTVRRFGWSETSEDEARVMAETRAGLALAQLLSGEKLARRETKVAYNGSDGLPIREEIVERHGDAVITRNSYGARCLNTPDVLFADVDFGEAPVPGWLPPLVALLVLVAGAFGYRYGSWTFAIVFGFVALGVMQALSTAARRLLAQARRTPEQRSREAIDRFLQAHPEWLLRLYRTPAGFRLLAMQRRFDPVESAVTEFFAAIGADKQYVRMCQLQQCFRARLTAKPWRIGIARHLLPRPGVWPVHPERLPERKRWIAEYERLAESHAACCYLESLGSGVPDIEVERTRELHDRLCQAESDLPLA